LVQARTEGQPSEDAEMLVVIRQRQDDGTWKYDYLLASAPLDTSREQFAWVFNAEHRIEEALKQAKGEAGLADYQVRTWEGWHHHQTLSLMATWFLTQETRRGKTLHPRLNRSASASHDRWRAEPPPRPPWTGTHSPNHGTSATAQRRSQAVSLETPQPLTASTL
jgi:SRSO17 transposase